MTNWAAEAASVVADLTRDGATFTFQVPVGTATYNPLTGANTGTPTTYTGVGISVPVPLPKGVSFEEAARIRKTYRKLVLASASMSAEPLPGHVCTSLEGHSWRVESVDVVRPDGVTALIHHVMLTS